MVIEKRIFGFDLLRCIAILLVLVTHTLLFIDPDWYKVPVYTGLFGVEFFFVLSGFLIGTILLKIHNRPRRLNLKDIRVFWIRRWFRTVPNYYLMFFVYAVVVYFSHHLNIFTQVKYLAYLVFLQNSVHYQPDNFFQVAWSLSIEEWFYLIFPLLLFLLTAIFKNNKARSFLAAILIFIIAELLIRMIVALTTNTYWDEGFRKLMPLRLDSIVMGVLAAYIKFHHPSSWNKSSKLKAVSGIILLALLTIYFAFDYVQFFDPVTWDHTFNPGVFLKTVFFTLLSISVALLFPYLNNMACPKIYIAKPVTFISKISYSLYLSHFFIILVVANIFKHLSHLKYENVLLFIAIWVATISVSAIQYNFFEVKMTALRNRFSREQTAIKI